MSAVAPQNAMLAGHVAPADLTKEKKALAHVPVDKVHTSAEHSGSVHLGPGKGQADFPVGAPIPALQQSSAASASAAAPMSELHRHSASSSVGSHATGGNHAASSHSGEVSVQSSVVIDTTTELKPQAAAQISSLLSRLSTTTSQIDQYSRSRTEAISKEANDRVQLIIANTQREQDLLLADASSRSLEIEGQYSAKLKVFLQELDSSKASNLAALERDLNFRQEQLLNNAREEMDAVHAVATQKKIGVMQQAQIEVNKDVDVLTDRVKQLGEAEVERRMNSTTTTVITTETKTVDAVSVSADKEVVAQGTVGERRTQ